MNARENHDVYNVFDLTNAPWPRKPKLYNIFELTNAPWPRKLTSNNVELTNVPWQRKPIVLYNFDLTNAPWRRKPLLFSIFFELTNAACQRTLILL